MSVQVPHNAQPHYVRLQDPGQPARFYDFSTKSGALANLRRMAKDLLPGGVAVCYPGKSTDVLVQAPIRAVRS